MGRIDVWVRTTIHAVGPRIESKVVFKNRSSSGTTRGIIEQSFARFGLDVTGRFADELFIISEAPHKPFSDCGGSGSWIVGQGNDLYGFILGGLVDRKNLGYRTYFTDIKLPSVEIQLPQL